jgi:hypothetical protein
MAIALICGAVTVFVVGGHDQRSRPEPTAMSGPLNTPKPASGSLPPEAEQVRSRPSVNPPVITQAEFAILSPGMALSSVRTVVGGPGEITEKTVANGVEHITLLWKGDGVPGAVANATFIDGQLVSKAEYGLR